MKNIRAPSDVASKGVTPRLKESTLLHLDATLTHFDAIMPKSLPSRCQWEARAVPVNRAAAQAQAVEAAAPAAAIPSPLRSPYKPNRPARWSILARSRARALSSQPSRSAGLGVSRAAQACLLATHAKCRRPLRVNCCRAGRRNNFRLAEAVLSGRRKPARVARNDLSQPVIQARGALKKELVKHLRSQQRIRCSRHSSVHGHSQGKIVDAIFFHERPAESGRSCHSRSWGGRPIAWGQLTPTWLG